MTFKSQSNLAKVVQTHLESQVTPNQDSNAEAITDTFSLVYISRTVFLYAYGRPCFERLVKVVQILKKMNKNKKTRSD